MSERGAALSTAVGAMGTFLAAILVVVQINAGAKNERVNRANAALWQYAFSVEFLERQRQVFEATLASDYTKIKLPKDVADPDQRKEAVKVYQALGTTLNGLEMLASGVMNCAYDETVIHRQLDKVIYKNVRAHILGLSMSGHKNFNDWKVDRALFPGQYEQLKALYDRWFPDGCYSDKLPTTRLGCGRMFG